MDIVYNYSFPQGSSLTTWNISCSSHVKTFPDCMRSVQSCSHTDDVAVFCTQPYQTRESLYIIHHYYASIVSVCVHVCVHHGTVYICMCVLCVCVCMHMFACVCDVLCCVCVCVYVCVHQ